LIYEGERPIFQKREGFLRKKERRENRGTKRMREKIKVERGIWSFCPEVVRKY
jgi:hypothetical protein